MKERGGNLSGEQAQDMWVSTFHLDVRAYPFSAVTRKRTG